MVAQEERRQMTVDEWWALLERSPGTKYEYIDGWIYLMAGGSLAHSTIGLNVGRLLQDALGDGPCAVYNSDAATRLSARRYTFPDVSVSCDERDRPSVGERNVVAPRLVVEVLSDTTEAYDRGDKFRYYQECWSVQEYMLIATKRQAVEVYRRTTYGWTYERYGPGDTVHCTSIDVRVPIAALYRRTDVPSAVEEPEGAV